MSIDQRLREGLRTTNDALPVPDIDRALAAVTADARRTRRRTVLVGLAAAAAAAAVVVGVLAVTGDEQDQAPQPAPSPSRTRTTAVDPVTIPDDPAEVLLVHRRPGGLEVAGETVPGRWELTETRHDVWVAIKTDANHATSQWWGKGATARPMPASRGDILPGAVAISQDARWIAWTRPAANIDDPNPPLVMEVVDTTTGEVRWSRNADTTVRQIGVIAVTNDGAVVFAHCLEPYLDEDGLQHCGDGRVDVWAPEADVVRTLPAGVSVGTVPFPDIPPTLSPLVQRTGAHNGLLVQSTEAARPQYLRVTDRGDVQIVATLPRNTVAVTADERFALLAEECSTGPFGCGDLSVVPLDGGERRPLRSLKKVPEPMDDYAYRILVERDDLLLVHAPFDGEAARCSLSLARCVPIKE